MEFAEAYISMIVRLWSAAQKMCVDCCAMVVCVSRHGSFFRGWKFIFRILKRWRMFFRRMSGNSSRPAVQQQHVIVTQQFGAPLLMGCISSEETATVITSDLLTLKCI